MNSESIAWHTPRQGIAATFAMCSASLQLDTGDGLTKNAGVANKNATGIGVPKSRRMSRHHSGYFFVRRHGTTSNGRAVRGSASCAGSLTRYANLHGSAHPYRDERKFLTAAQEAIMPNVFSRELRVLFPIRPISLLTLFVQGEAGAIDALFVSQGKRCAHSDQSGYNDAEVTA